MLKHKPAGQNIVENFQEVVPALTSRAAIVEANRCLFCDDAPCTQACPTGIDVPMFIRKIATGSVKGSAKQILDANPLGASCARVCPTEELCVGACVLNDLTVPIMIGELQRHATDYVMERGIQLYESGPANGKKIAIVGGGPAGLAAARELARLGYAATIFEEQEKAGGLNTYGVAPFRLPQNVALWEVEQIEALGVNIRSNVKVGKDVSAQFIMDQYDAILLAVGMGKIRKLGIEGESLPGVIDALDLIKQTKDGDPEAVHIGRKVAVIGAGNTAIDAATTSKRLGAEMVQILYRRTENEMTAYPFEYEFAKQDGIEFRWLTLPRRIIGTKRVEGIECLKMRLSETDENGRPIPVPISGSEFVIEVDNVVLATGQTRNTELLEHFGVKHDNGIAVVDNDMRTSHPKVFAAGDCVFDGRGGEATVVLSVEQGKQAAYTIHRKFIEEQNGKAN